MKNTFDVIIIGAGIIGASIAFDLSRRGKKTLNVDMLPAAGYGSTSYSCAVIRTHYSYLDSTALAYESYFRWADWAGYLGVEDELGFAKFHQSGCLVMKTPGNNGLSHITEHMKTLNIPWQDWNKADILKKFPFLDLRNYAPPKLPDHPEFAEPTGNDIEGAIFFPRAGYMNDPQLCTHNIQRAAEHHGAQFHFNAKVSDIKIENRRVSGITLENDEQIDAPVVVNVAGPHSSKINDLAGVTGKKALSTRALRVEVAHVDAPEGYDIEHEGVFFSDNDVGCYARPEVGNRMVVGGENPACDPEDWVDPDDYSEDQTDQMRNQVMRLAQRMPTLGIPGRISGIVACYDVTPDWIPVYDRSDVDGYYMAIGTSGNQFKNAPVVGALMADLIEACENGHDHDNDPVTFHLERLNRPLSIGFFSRNREINNESSFSVLG